MRVCSLVMTALVFCMGCDGMERIRHTTFFLSHDAAAHLTSVATAKGYQNVLGGSGQSLGGPTGRKEFEVAIKGDSPARDAFMREYKGFVEGELARSGATITGEGSWGQGDSKSGHILRLLLQLPSRCGDRRLQGESGR